MDYTISDMQGYALITQTETDITVVAVPFPMGDEFFAFRKIITCDTKVDAKAIVAALITGGYEASGYYDDDEQEEGNAGPEPAAITAGADSAVPEAGARVG